MANEKLADAKNSSNDEFYTQYEDIQNEINAYLEYDSDVFKGKTILLPCDDPEWSNFTRFFAQNFDNFGLKKLISTSYAIESRKIQNNYRTSIYETESPRFDEHKTRTHGKIFTLTHDINKSGNVDIDDLEWSYLKGDGDFKSDEVKGLRDEADIIITNPPFSLFKDFLAWIVEANKKFVIIGHQNAITYKEVFPLMKDNRIWLGKGFKGGAAHFINRYYTDYATASDHVDGMIRVSGVVWFSNIEHGRRHQPMSLMTMVDNIKFSKHKELNGKEYVRYLNFDAIDVPFTNSIPKDYRGVMGVPKSFMGSYCVEQFKILGYEREDENIKVGIHHMPEEFLSDYRKQGGRGHYTKGMKMLCCYDSDEKAKIPFSRILIKYTEEWIESHTDDFKQKGVAI